jgi:hypothetical protein
VLEHAAADAPLPLVDHVVEHLEVDLERAALEQRRERQPEHALGLVEHDRHVAERRLDQRRAGGGTEQPFEHRGPPRSGRR